MSYVRKAKNGYYGYASYKDSNGKRRYKSAGKFKLKRDALAKADELEKQLQAGDAKLKDISLVDYFKRWYETYKRANLSDNTRGTYESSFIAISKYFNDKKLAEITRTDYQQFINWYSLNHALGSVKQVNRHIRACVSYAIDDDIIVKDFTKRVQLVENKKRGRHPEYLTTSELVRFKDAVLNRLDGVSTAPYMVLTAIYTGMRKSEIQALTWKDIDFLHGTISINKSWDDLRKKNNPTKNASSVRTIPVNRALLDALADLKANHSVRVFQNVLGVIPNGRKLNRLISSILDDAGISKKDFSFHSLRHVHVAFLIGQGVDIYAISKRLGHSNVTTTLDIYSYLVDEYKAKNDNLIIEKLKAL